MAHFVIKIELDESGKFCKRRHGLGWVISQYPVELQRPGHLARSQIQLPAAQVPQTLGLRQQGLASNKLLFRFLSFADVARDDGEAQRLARIIAQPSDHHFRPETRTILPHPPAFTLKSALAQHLIDLANWFFARNILGGIES